MKKKILFVIPTLSSGGAERALVSMLNLLDFNLFEVDLLLLEKNDMFYADELSKSVNIVQNDIEYSITFDKLKDCFWLALQNRKFLTLFRRLFMTLAIRWNLLRDNKNIDYWEMIKDNIEVYDKHYDFAIAYLEGNSIYFVADKISANKKIGWIHTDYIKAKHEASVDYKYFKKMDYLYTVSNPMAETLKQAFPDLSQKIQVMYNVVDFDAIINKSQGKNPFDDKFSGTRIVSIGNVSYAKGYDIAILACKRLVDSGINIEWYVIGRGNNDKQLNDLIDSYNLRETFIMLGEKKNPYPYLKNGDIFVQSSRYEGFSTTVHEAKILLKPIVITNCDGMKDQIRNGINGSVVEINEIEIANSIERLIKNPSVMEEYKCALKNELEVERCNNSQMNILYKVLKI